MLDSGRYVVTLRGSQISVSVHEVDRLGLFVRCHELQSTESLTSDGSRHITEVEYGRVFSEACGTLDLVIVIRDIPNEGERATDGVPGSFWGTSFAPRDGVTAVKCPYLCMGSCIAGVFSRRVRVQSFQCPCLRMILTCGPQKQGHPFSRLAIDLSRCRWTVHAMVTQIGVAVVHCFYFALLWFMCA